MSATLEFFSGLLDGFQLIALAVSVGGITYLLFILRLNEDGEPIRILALNHTFKTIAYAAGAFALMQALQLLFKSWALVEEMTLSGWSDFAHTRLFQAAVSRIGLGLGLAVAVARWRQRPQSPLYSGPAVLLAFMLLWVEGWLSHAASRLEGSAPLTAVTVLHELGAMMWAGGVIHLWLFWRLTRRYPEALWPVLLSRFSLLGGLSMVLIIGPGAYLGWNYAGSWNGFVGTGHGNMLVAKILFLTIVLVFAVLNFFAARRRRQTGEAAALYARLPAYLEIEVGLALALLLSAAALSALPRATDVSEEMATPMEVWAMFSPKRPNLHGPELYLVPAPELTDASTGRLGLKEDLNWSNFNHNLSGIIVIVMALLAWLDRTGHVTWARHWPLLFIGFALFILVLADTEVWPLGSVGLIESLRDPEILQHRFAALVTLGLGVFEWRARTSCLHSGRLPYVFPVLCGVGGIVLLTHAHAVFELKQEFLIQVTHVSMGFLAVVMGCMRWLELRLPPPQDRIAGFASISAMLLIGILLLFYYEPHWASVASGL